ncbi:MAG: rod shape-determining protein MreD [Candidatus Omnitrophica bacterium]|nr:rod shape-determining protein MreD [Candidatus Omnitrophota bacterium]
MMRKILFIVAVIFIAFLVEFLLFNFVGRWIMPNLLLLVVIFFNLLWGIRFSLFTAVIAGLLQDSFSTNPFGVHLFSFVVCAFAATLIKKIIYPGGSRSIRLLLVSLIVIVNFLVQFFLHMVFGVVDVRETMRFIFIPEMLTTLIVTNYCFNQLKICVLKFFV